VRPQRNLATSPLFQTLIVLQNTDWGALDASIEPYELESRVSMELPTECQK